MKWPKCYQRLLNHLVNYNGLKICWVANATCQIVLFNLSMFHYVVIRRYFFTFLIFETFFRTFLCYFFIYSVDVDFYFVVYVFVLFPLTWYLSLRNN